MSMHCMHRWFDVNHRNQKTSWCLLGCKKEKYDCVNSTKFSASPRRPSHWLPVGRIAHKRTNLPEVILLWTPYLFGSLGSKQLRVRWLYNWHPHGIEKIMKLFSKHSRSSLLKLFLRKINSIIYIATKLFWFEQILSESSWNELSITFINCSQQIQPQNVKIQLNN